MDGVKIENDSISPYIINWTSTVGTHTLTAIATDNNGAHTTSDAGIITISPVTGINDIIYIKRDKLSHFYFQKIAISTPIISVIQYDVPG